MKSFLKWPGGKGTSGAGDVILSLIADALISGSGRLIDPFTGSGYIPLNAGAEKTLACDLNADNIAAFNLVKSGGAEGAKFIAYAHAMFMDHRDEEAFLRLRRDFNASHDLRFRAAALICLDHLCFNGIVRYNRRGGFNSAYGWYEDPYFPEKELLAFHEFANAADVTFICRDFRETILEASAGDVVYCDPPYLPLSATANFTGYTPGGFGMADHEDLAKLARAAADRGATVIISNHDLPVTRELYAGAEITGHMANRMAGGKAERRAKAKELIAVFRPAAKAAKAAKSAIAA